MVKKSGKLVGRESQERPKVNKDGKVGKVSKDRKLVKVNKNRKLGSWKIQ